MLRWVGCGVQLMGSRGGSHGLDRGLLDARREVLEGRVADVAVVAVVGPILVVVSELEAEHVIHELHGDVVAKEHHVVAGGSVRPQVGLGSLRDAGVAHEGRPDEAVHGLVPQDGADGGVVEAGEEADLSLVVVLADLPGNEPCLVLVVHGKTSVHVDLVHEGCGESGLSEG